MESGKEEIYGGSVTLADYCPYIQEFTWKSKNVIVRGSHCQYADNNPSKIVMYYLMVLHHMYVYIQRVYANPHNGMVMHYMI